VCDVIHALPYSFEDVSFRGDVEQALVGFCVLNNGFRFTVDRKNDWPFGFLQAFHELGGLAPKRGQRLYVFRDIKHGQPFSLSIFKGAPARAVCKEKNPPYFFRPAVSIWMVGSGSLAQRISAGCVPSKKVPGWTANFAWRGCANRR
jgi:hypothetical protein